MQNNIEVCFSKMDYAAINCYSFKKRTVAPINKKNCKLCVIVLLTTTCSQIEMNIEQSYH